MNPMTYGAGTASAQAQAQPAVPSAPARGSMSIPTNVAGIVIISAGVLVFLNLARFKFVVGVGVGNG